MGNALKTRKRENWKIKFFMSANSQKRRETAQKRFFFSLPLCCISSRRRRKEREKRNIRERQTCDVEKEEERGLPPSLPVSVPFCLGKKEEAEAEREKVNKKIWERGGGKERKERGRETDNATLSINPTTHTKTATKFSFYFCRLPINSLLQIWSA